MAQDPNKTFWTASKDHVILRIRVQPGAKKTEISGMHGDRLKIRIQSPPVDGKANDALIDFLRKFLKIKLSEIKIIRGEKSKDKDIKISLSQLSNLSRLFFDNQD